MHCACVYSTATPQPIVELANFALDSLDITWTVSSAMDVTNYTVYWSEVPSGAGGSRTLGNDIMQASIPDLRSNTAYMIRGGRSRSRVSAKWPTRLLFTVYFTYTS